MTKPMTHTADIFRTQNQDIRAKVALTSESECLTYGDLDHLSNRMANIILDQGFSSGCRVAILDKNSATFATLIGGILKARMVPVLVNFRLGQAEIEYILRDSQSQIICIGPEHEALIPALQQALPDLVILPLEDMVARCETTSAQDPLLAHKATDTVLQLYTSGTTGHPKGACFSDAAFMAAAEILPPKANFITPEDVQLIAMPLCHIAAYNALMFGLHARAQAVIMRDLIPDLLLPLFPRHKITTTLFAPAVIQILVSHPLATETDFSAMRCMFYGAAPITQALLTKARSILGCDFCQLYGMTENLGIAAFLKPEDHAPERGKLRSCGTAYVPEDLQIARPDGTLCRPDEIGEIQTRGTWNMTGYWNKPHSKSEDYNGDWFKTGDAAFQDAEGYIFIQDRIKDMIITGGENVYPVEVENALSHHPDVVDCAVFGIPDEDWGESVKAAVVLTPGTAENEAALLIWLRDRIAAFKVPKSIDFIPVLPRNATGKILKKDLRAPYWQGRHRRIS